MNPCPPGVSRWPADNADLGVPLFGLVNRILLPGGNLQISVVQGSVFVRLGRLVCLSRDEEPKLRSLESVPDVGEWQRPHWCHPEQGCLRVELVRVVVPKNWDLLSRRQQGAVQTVISALLVANDAPTLLEEKSCHVQVVVNDRR